MVIVTNTDTTALFKAFTTDGGLTWTGSLIATGSDGLVAACCDPSVSFDQYGNCFVAYLDSADVQACLILSIDGGATFKQVANFPASDQPTVVTGPGDLPGTGSVWLRYENDATNSLQAVGARVTGLNSVGTFIAPEIVSGSIGDNFGSIAIGPAGQVIVAFEDPSTGAVFVGVDPDGLGALGFTTAVFVATTNYPFGTLLPASPNRETNSKPGLAWDRTSGTHAGRIYLIYCATASVGNNDTNVFMQFSDTSGASWSSPVKVNDDAGTNSQFLARVAIDQTSGNVGVSWYDCRNSGSNDTTQYFGTITTDGGLTFLPNFQIATGASNASTVGDPNDYGDYSGLAFFGGIMAPAWADNSNSTADNPDGVSNFDIYTASVTPPVTAVPPVITSPTTASGNVGILFSYTITATGSLPIVFSAAGLPPGLFLSGNLISGYPTVAGTYNVLISASNGGGTVFQTVVVTIGPPVPPTFTSPGSINVFAGQPFSFTPTASGSVPLFFSATGLPAGVTFQLGYLLTGSIAVPGTYTVTLTATNAAGTTTQILTIIVGLPSPDGDADGDGIPNGLEQTLGTDPFSDKSTPFVNNNPAFGSRLFNFKKMDIKKKGGGKDLISLSGSLPILSQGYKVAGEQFLSLTLNIIQKLTLLNNGTGTSNSNGKMKVRVSGQSRRVGTQNAQFNLAMQGDYTSPFATAGFDGKTDIEFTVYVLFNRTVYSQKIKYSGVTRRCSLAQ
jgi:hypothetical protein